MPTADRTARRTDGRRPSSPTHGRAFGIELEAGFLIPELPEGRHGPGIPLTRLVPARREELLRAWPSRGTDRLVHRTFPDGSPMMVVERHEDEGYCVWAPRHGRHLISTDGSRVRSALPRISSWRWERLLFAQVLPLASALSGRELFHASAVAFGGGAFAFVGLSGAGKSSVAAHLVSRGASLVTDDVLALEVVAGRVLAFPGACLAGLDARELAAMSAEGRARLGALLGTSDKVYLSAPVVDGPIALRGLYFLARGRGNSVEIAPARSTPSLLLGSSFFSYLRSPQHLVHHLDVCALIAQAVPTLEVFAPASTRATEVAAAVETHSRGLLAGSR